MNPLLCPLSPLSILSRGVCEPSTASPLVPCLMRLAWFLPRTSGLYYWWICISQFTFSSPLTHIHKQLAKTRWWLWLWRGQEGTLSGFICTIFSSAANPRVVFCSLGKSMMNWSSFPILYNSDKYSLGYKVACPKYGVGTWPPSARCTDLPSPEKTVIMLGEGLHLKPLLQINVQLRGESHRK